MANGNEGKHRHFILEGVTETEPYRSRGGGRSPEPPGRDRAQHGGALRRQMEEIRTAADAAREARQEAGMEEGIGLQVEFESFPDVELAFESLARERSGIELLNVRHEEARTHATVFVPDGKLDHFENLIRDYLVEKRDSRGHVRDNKRLIDAIRQIRAASIRALWTDARDAFPATDEESFWWEVWLPVRRDRQAVVSAFQGRAEAQGMRVAPGLLVFPERTVLLIHASAEQMQRSVPTLDSIAELRRAKETAEFFDSLLPEAQPEWLEELLARIRYPANADEVPHVCLLDTGVNRGHPLIEPSLGASDLHTVEPGWGVDDNDGHGTEMAGLALAGNLTELLDGNDPVELGHRLESVKLLPSGGATGTDPRHHGYLTVEAAARPEVTAPLRPRVFGLAVTARDNRDRGRPSAWSAALDALAADVGGSGASPRLLIVSAGNVPNPDDWNHYPHSNETDGIHDPAQAWNALTVGACTDLVRITEPDAAGYAPIAPGGGLSPFSTTSLIWEKHWPLKPDVVLEGGNAAKGRLGAVWMPSLSLLTTHYRPDGSVVHHNQRHQRGHRARIPAGGPGDGCLSRPVAGNSSCADRAFGGMDRCHEAHVPSRGKTGDEGGPPAPAAAMRVRRSESRPGALECREFLDDGRTGEPESIQARAVQATHASRHAPPQPALAPRRSGKYGRSPGRDAGHPLLLHRAQSIAARGSITLPVRVPRPPLRRQAATRNDRCISQTHQLGGARRGRRSRWRRCGSLLAHRNEPTSSRLAAWRCLAGDRRGACRPGQHRRLSCVGLVENTPRSRTIRSAGKIRPGGRNQGSGDRCRSPCRGGKSDLFAD